MTYEARNVTTVTMMSLRIAESMCMYIIKAMLLRTALRTEPFALSLRLRLTGPSTSIRCECSLRTTGGGLRGAHGCIAQACTAGPGAAGARMSSRRAPRNRVPPCIHPRLRIILRDPSPARSQAQPRFSRSRE